MSKTEQIGMDFRVTGHPSQEEAEAHVQRLRRTYEVSHGFWMKTPVELKDDGSWGFRYARGSHCD